MVLENTVDGLYMNLAKLKEHTDKLTILFLGRLHESKGINVLLASIKTLIGKGHKNLQFVFCGTGPLLNDVLKITEAYPENVSYMGVVSGEAKNEILVKAQVFVLPSLYGEGLPMSLLEAMSAGLVPIVTNDGSMKSIVTHSETGYIIQKNNSSVLTRQIEQLIANPGSVGAISNNAKAYVADKFSITKYIRSLNELYKVSIA